MNEALYHRKLDRALDRMGALYSLRDIRRLLDEGALQSFAHNNSWLVCQLNQFPQAKALDFVIAVGDLSDWRPLHDAALRFADEQNVSVVRAFGRRGWIAQTREAGWRLKTVNQVYIKEL